MESITASKICMSETGKFGIILSSNFFQVWYIIIGVTELISLKISKNLPVSQAGIDFQE